MLLLIIIIIIIIADWVNCLIAACQENRIGISVWEALGAATVNCLLFVKGTNCIQSLSKSSSSFLLVSNSHHPLSFNFKFIKVVVLLFQRHVGFETKLLISLYWVRQMMK